jgi:hypothetical protein
MKTYTAPAIVSIVSAVEYTLGMQTGLPEKTGHTKLNAGSMGFNL